MIVFDDFITDRALLDSLAKSDEFQTRREFAWWGGWWNRPADNLRERVVQQIWKECCPLPDARALLESAAGFEYWTGVMDARVQWNRSLDNHRDRDEALFSETGREAFPLMGAVYYPLNHDVEGGYLRIFTDDREDGPAEFIQPRYNRLVIFDASRLHGVTTVTSGRRHSLVVNVWPEPIRLWRPPAPAKPPDLQSAEAAAPNRCAPPGNRPPSRLRRSNTTATIAGAIDG